MAEGKLDLPDDLLSSNPSDHSWTSKVEASGGNSEDKMIGYDSKDQAALDNSIPLSPQWLYSKPGESKMEMRAPSSLSLGSSGDSSLKEAWRSDGSEDKKDWRKPGSETESGRRWREEERETGGLLAGRRERRKTDRRADVAVTDNKAPSSDRWVDREARRDSSKWSSRWGPDEKEKEKRTDADKEDDTQRVDTDSRDKWRPRHRMDSSFRAAPGFGAEKGGRDVGFTVGRGRSGGSASSASSIEGVPGKPSGDVLFYPRGKLLDIYRMQKLDPSFGSMPERMQEVPCITQAAPLEPLAFVAPDAEEEGILGEISKGKLTGSELRLRISDNITDVLDLTSANGKENTSLFDSQRPKIIEGRDGTWAEEQRVPEMESYSMQTTGSNSDKAFNLDNYQPASFDINAVNDSNSVFNPQPSSEAEQYWERSMQPLEEANMMAEELSLYYRDPQGEVQGPFLGVDIISWFEQGFFGADLPVRVADAPDEAPFMELGHVMPHLISSGPSPNLDKSDDDNWQMAELNGLSRKHAEARIGEGQQSFHDEEIVFPGSSEEFINQKHTEENKNKMHPFGLLWSELEGSSLRNDEGGLSGGGIQHQQSERVPDSADAWSDMYRRNGPPHHMDEDANVKVNEFDMSEKLRSHQIQQQLLQQHNLLNSHPHLNESMQGRVKDHLMALQLQQQQQRRIEQQQQQQQMLLLKEQQSRQLLLEQLAQNQMQMQMRLARSNSNNNNNALDQILLKHQILNEMQQQQRLQHVGHHPSEVLELMAAHAKQEQMFQGRQMAMGLRQRMEMEMEEERRLWPTSSGLSPLDIVYHQQQSQREELTRSLSMQERQRSLRDMARPPQEFGSALHHDHPYFQPTQSQIPNEWIQLQQRHVDHNEWMSAGTIDDPSKRLLMELLHHNQSTSEASSLDHTSYSMRNNQHATTSYGSRLVDETNNSGPFFSEPNMQRPFFDNTTEDGIIFQQGEISINAAGGSMYSDKPESFAGGEHGGAVKRPPDNILLRRPPVSTPSPQSHEGGGFYDLGFRGRDASSMSLPEGENLAGGKKEGRLRRRTSSSLSDADVAETASFSDMLKKTTTNNNNKSPDSATTASEDASSDAHNKAAAAGTGKKKGKKGRQIDPALLGFKVTSNRIMMGEIQRIQD